MATERLKIFVIIGALVLFLVVPLFISLISPSFFSSGRVDSPQELKEISLETVIISDVKFERGVSILLNDKWYYIEIDYNQPNMYLPESHFKRVIKKGNHISKKQGDSYFIILGLDKEESIIYFR